MAPSISRNPNNFTNAEPDHSQCKIRKLAQSNLQPRISRGHENAPAGNFCPTTATVDDLIFPSVSGANQSQDRTLEMGLPSFNQLHNLVQNRNIQQQQPSIENSAGGDCKNYGSEAATEGATVVETQVIDKDTGAITFVAKRAEIEWRERSEATAAANTLQSAENLPPRPSTSQGYTGGHGDHMPQVGTPGGLVRPAREYREMEVRNVWNLVFRHFFCNIRVKSGENSIA